MAPSSTTPVWLFVPNLIGYTRVVTGLASLIYAFNDKTFGTFFAFYAFSYILDAVDGVAARALKQTSRFGALLDMVTDRFCTAALLAVLAHHFPDYSAAFLGLMVLDIVSHWAQMYSSMAVGANSHKNLADEPALLKFYYTFPYALFTVCLFNEACLLAMFMLKHESAVQAFIESSAFLSWSSTLVKAITPLFFEAASAAAVSVPRFLLYITFPVFALKQLFSVMQLGKAASRIVALDEAERKKN